MPWSQIYDPFGALAASTLVAAIPVLVLLGTLALFKWHAHNAALAGLAAALVVAIGAFHTKLDDDFRVVAATKEEAAEIRRGMQAVEERITKDMDPLVAASQMDVDEVVTPGELRMWLEAMLEMSYQSTGYRRVKNPRLWSLHDLDVLTGGARCRGRSRRGRATRWTCGLPPSGGGAICRSPARCWGRGRLPVPSCRAGGRSGWSFPPACGAASATCPPAIAAWPSAGAIFSSGSHPSMSERRPPRPPPPAPHCPLCGVEPAVAVLAHPGACCGRCQRLT